MPTQAGIRGVFCGCKAHGLVGELEANAVNVSAL